MTGLLELADRCEKALETHQVMLLWEAWEAIHDKAKPVAIDRWPGWRMPFAWDRFKAMVNAHAYLDAAMTLVPEGALFDVGHFGDEKPGVFLSSVMPVKGKTQSAEAATPALALCAAALRARANEVQT